MVVTPGPLSKEETIDAVKQAHKEYLDELVTKMGWFSIRWIGTVVVAGIIGYWIKIKGFG